MHNYTCTCTKGVQYKSHLHGTGTSSLKPWPPCCMCHCPAVFFRHSILIAFSFPQKKKIGALCKKQTLLL